jgi:hypothetical protein
MRPGVGGLYRADISTELTKQPFPGQTANPVPTTIWSECVKSAAILTLGPNLKCSKL